MISFLQLREKIKLDAGEKEVSTVMGGKGKRAEISISKKGNRYSVYINSEKLDDNFTSEKEAKTAADDFLKLMGEELQQGLDMKLIAEYFESDLQLIQEADKNGKKSLAIEGVFMQADQKNRNGRIYEKKILERAVAKYVKEQVNTGRAVGELNHPEGPQINLDKVSHRITELRWDGSDVIGKASILNTPMGNIVSGLLEGGVKLGVSSRGMGSLVQKNGINYVTDDFMLSTVDIVQDPSAPEAFVNGIMEGVDWIWDNGVLKQQEIELIETEIKTARNIGSSDIEIKAFKNFLSKLV